MVLAALLLIANLYNDTGNVSVKVAQSGFSRPHTEYSNKVTEILNQSPLSKSKLTINYNAVEQGIVDEFPEVEQAHLSAALVGSKTTLEITLSDPVLVMNTDGGQYLINQQGRVISEVNKAYELPFLYDRTSVIVNIGESTLRADQVQFILEIKSMHENRGNKVESFELPEKTSNQVDVKLTGKEYILKYSFSLESTIQTGKYYALLPTIEQGSKPTKYVDLRVGERAYIK